MTHTIRLTLACRIKALEAGQWQCSDGRFIRLDEMADDHLVNALLKALTDGDPPALTRLLTAEVVRRNLGAYAMTKVQAL